MPAGRHRTLQVHFEPWTLTRSRDKQLMSRKKAATRHKAHPANLPIWIGTALMAVVAQLPWRVLLACGRGIGRLSWWLARKRRHILETNIRLCFPELSAEEQTSLAKSCMISTGEGIMELVGAYFRLHPNLDGRLEVQGREHLEAARAGGKGVLLMGMHFTTLEVAACLLSKTTPYGAVYRPNDNPLLDAIIRFGRGRYVSYYIDRADVRGLVRRLKKGDAVWYAPDQDYGRKHSVYAPFFGMTAATITATSRIARLSGCPVVPVSYFRKPGGRYCLRFDKPLRNFPSGDDYQDAVQVNRAVEAAVRRAPEQYLWVHKRFKHQPDGKSPYS